MLQGVKLKCGTHIIYYDEKSGRFMGQGYDSKPPYHVEKISQGDVSRLFVIKKEKPFDIGEHEFSDSTVNNAYVDAEDLVIPVSVFSGQSKIWISKTDAIAIAKALGVTGEDL